MTNKEKLKYSIIATRKKTMTVNFIIGLILLPLFEITDIENCHELYLLYSIWLLIVWSWLTLSELKYPGLNILSVFFAGSVMAIAYPSFSYALDLNNNISVRYSIHDISHFLFRTSVAINLYFSLFIILITLFTHNKLFIVDIKQLVNRFNFFYLAVCLYLLSIVLRLIPFLEYLSSTLANLGNSVPMLVLMLLALYCGYNGKRDKYYYLFIVLIIAEVFYLTFFGYYKGAVVRAAMMYVLYYYMYCRTVGKKLINTQFILIIIFSFLFLLYFIYPFISIRRIESGFGANSEASELMAVDNIDVLQRVITFNYSADMINEKGNTSALSDRMSQIAPSTYFYSDAYFHGTKTDIIKHSVGAMIPRFLYPQKPSGSGGAMAASYIVSGSFDSDYHTAESIGPFASAYFWGRWPAVFFMCLINAFVISLLLKVCFSNLHNLFSWIVLFFLIFSLLMCFKETYDGGYSQDILYLIYATIVTITSKMFLHKKRNNRHLI